MVSTLSKVTQLGLEQVSDFKAPLYLLDRSGGSINT